MKFNFLKRLLTLTVAASMVMSSMNVMAAEVNATEAVVEAAVNETESEPKIETDNEANVDSDTSVDEAESIDIDQDSDNTDTEMDINVDTDTSTDETDIDADTNINVDANVDNNADKTTTNAATKNDITAFNVEDQIMPAYTDEDGNEHYYYTYYHAETALQDYLVAYIETDNEYQKGLYDDFMTEWTTKLYASKTESEANEILKQAESPWAEVLSKIKEDHDKNHYYESWNRAYDAVFKYCDLPTSGLTDAQVELLGKFTDEWSDKAYAAKDESEANAVLEQAKAAWPDVLKQINDKDAMAERDKFLKLKNSEYETKNAIHSKWNHDYSYYYSHNDMDPLTYTKASRELCASKMNDALTKIIAADTQDDLDAACKEFDAILETYLEKLSNEVLEARTNATDELNSYYKNDLASLSGVTWKASEIYEYETVSEIETHVTEQKANMLEYVETHVGDYFHKICYDMLHSYKAEFGLEENVIFVVSNKYNFLVDVCNAAYSERKDSITSKAIADQKFEEVKQLTEARANEIRTGIPATSLTIEKTSIEVEADENGRGNVLFEDMDLGLKVLPANTTDLFSYRSSDERIFKPNAYQTGIYVFEEGTGTLTITCGSQSVKLTVVVKEKTINVTSVTLNKNTLTLKVDETEKLTTTITPSNATNQTANWMSSNTSVATVANDGTITALATGSTTITVTVDGKTDTCVVTVEAKEPTTTDPDNSKVNVESITLDRNSLTLKVDDTDTLTATVNPTNATDKTVTWVSSNPTVATVNNGLVTALTTGKTTITATADGKSATCEVTVEAKAETPGNTKVNVTSVTLNKNTLSLKVNETDTLTATVAPDNATDKTVAWTSSKPAVATVDSNGKVTAVSEGTTTIKATADGQTDTCTVTVTKANESNNGSGNEESTKPGTTPGTGNETNNGNTNTGNSNTSTGSNHSGSSSSKTDSDTNKKSDSNTTYVESHPAYTSATVTNNSGIENLAIRYQRMETPDLTAYKDAIGDTTVACFFDITAWISGSNATELGKDVEITIQIPSEFLKEGRTFYLIRNHEGKIVRLNDIDSNANTITVRTSDFSGYLLTYSDNVTTTSSSPKTGDTMNVFGYMTVAFVCMVGMTFGLERKKEEV